VDATEFVVKKALDTTKEAAELTDRDQHLLGLAVTLTRGCQQCTGSRIENALKAGITYETLRAAIDFAAAVNAGVVLRTAIAGSELYNLDQACTGPECSVEKS